MIAKIKIKTKTNELRQVSKGNLGVAINNLSGKLFDEDGDELILDPHNQNGIVFNFLLGGRTVASPQTILKEKD